MIIWTRYGFIAPFLPIGGYMGVATLCQKAYGADYINHHSWPGALGTLLGAVALWVIAEKIAAPPRKVVDPKTGETLLLTNRDTFFWIPLNYFAGLMVVVAVGMLIFKTESSL